ncbi:probable G-protein coupled receptor 141 isoform X2 [Labrus mixtus]|uniref:probable G-protein coupled receptor 141 isoform X2 n=1 Tax=Labrus mixtus TaxID=508554 RepID=UPI0029C01486|nr:probable G-protein coupled receptor 141 isoform X2 [Labrus mixtus]XP_060920209.1 probable G-protein coupled receptor 141 isoform X2 [Labrus mixtus]
MQDSMMNSTETQTNISTSSSPLTTTCSASDDPHPDYHNVLLAIYSVVLLSGTISLTMMVYFMKSSNTSITSIAVLNLIFSHFIFLVTVPFRIYYYATGCWQLGDGWCKVVSSMIHIHMYMSFLFYVIILITRLMAFYHRAGQAASFQMIQALLISAGVWVVVLVAVPSIITFSYGKDRDTNSTHCFKFGESIKAGAKVINYIISTLIIVVATVLTVLQANVLRVLYRKHHDGCTSQQDFGAQVKSMCFALVMVVCFIPYHIFRLHYLEHVSAMQSANEVFLSLTTFNCLDMLTFLGRRNCYMCFLGREG